jgi:periplasmic protein CpxP/Spy
VLVHGDFTCRAHNGSHPENNRFQPSLKGTPMKIAQRLLIIAGLLSSLTAPVFAQSTTAPTGEGQRPMRMEKMRERMVEQHNKHLNELKAKLQLQTGQDTAWSAFALAMQAPAKALPHPDRAALEKLTTPERIDQMQAFRAQRDAQMQKRAEATKTFYASLNAEQKKTFDAETAQFMGKRMNQGHPMHH